MLQIQVASFSGVGSNTARVQEEEEEVVVLLAIRRNPHKLLGTGANGHIRGTSLEPRSN